MASGSTRANDLTTSRLREVDLQLLLSMVSLPNMGTTSETKSSVFLKIKAISETVGDVVLTYCDCQGIAAKEPSSSIPE